MRDAAVVSVVARGAAVGAVEVSAAKVALVGVAEARAALVGVAEARGGLVGRVVRVGERLAVSMIVRTLVAVSGGYWGAQVVQKHKERRSASVGVQSAPEVFSWTPWCPNPIGPHASRIRPSGSARVRISVTRVSQYARTSS
ncbi:hypothetical protein [Nonomuraea sp. NPDC005692]|uniref:hypothetical protein n=1 Tax=Nonomuraea sp. NPDC005692 TaxID=3157168 RepID=UPI0033F8456C